MDQKTSKKIRMEILPETKDIIYEQRESGVTHSPFQLEYVLYQGIKEGNTETVIQTINTYFDNGFVVGRLSKDNIRQIKYWSVSCIALAVHYAILGGVDETEAFNLSDVYIRHIDQLTTIEECIFYMREKAVELTELVRQTVYKNVTTPSIRKVLHYINIHLHERLKIETIAKEVGISRDYLSVLFKKEMNISVHSYIVSAKLEASKTMLIRGDGYDTISYNYGFCSETHYIACFKRAFGITPGEYRKNLYN